MKYANFFSNAAGFGPHTWQAELGAETSCQDRLLRVPTGFGKTLGVLNAWLYNRVERNDDAWPRRLVWCLPMRVLVEQTQSEVRQALTRLGKLWNEAGKTSHEGKVGVHLLMGGADAGDWHLHPEHAAVLIGTQDMLLSRALNRGYGSHRARWPIDFGLLNQDCLWIMDEVQLMDVGLATSGQLQAFRGVHLADAQLSRPCRSWWMSATLQRDWLAKSPETAPLAGKLPQTSIGAPERTGHLWDDVQKPLRVETAKDDATIAKLAADEHIDAGHGKDGPTLIVVNRVDAAVNVYSLLNKDKRLKDADIRLVHSRFRPRDREGWRVDFLNRQACGPGTNRIIVATQVVEAGVDMSAAVLLTDLAPWSSLVQRFGRAARWGGRARLLVVNRQVKDDKAAAPYEKAELDAALGALAYLEDGSPLALERFEEEHPELLTGLYPYSPKHLLLSHELDDLFDTTADLSGADIDVSRFIRSGEERDVQVFWLPIPTKERPNRKLRPQREALCSVPFLKARDWLCEKGSQLKAELRRRVWVWDWLDGDWRVLEARDIHPGQTILVDSALGGYDPVLGFRPASKSEVPLINEAKLSLVEQLEELADATESDEHLSVLAGDQPVVWQTIAVHGAQVGREAAQLAQSLCPNFASLFDLAGRWHDLGKAHEAFQNSISHDARPKRDDLAKAPANAWPRKKLYSMGDGARNGFRHELASTLGLFGVLRRHMPQHAALLGPWRDVLPLIGGTEIDVGSVDPPTDVEKEILALSAEDFDLLAYLVCSHHGKVRLAWHASPADQKANDSEVRIRGVREGDYLPGIALATSKGDYVSLPETGLSLSPAAVGLSLQTGRSWTDRALGLVRKHSAFQLGYLEAVLRAADIRASRSPVADPLIEANTHVYGLERSNSPLAQSATGGAPSPGVGADPRERGGEHGIRGRAGRSGTTQVGTRAPASATRFVESTLGHVSYAALAIHLAKRVAQIEARILEGAFDNVALDEYLLESLHKELCATLTPQLAGWRKVDVLVGGHSPPPFFQVRALAREYASDLETRLNNAGGGDELLLETLAFAEGRLLSIHPFADFNGRLTRVFLRLLLRKLVLPNINLTPTPDETQEYLDALRAGDQTDWGPLIRIWRERFSQGVEE